MVIGGEVTTKANINPDTIARKVIHDIGYTKPEFGFDSENVAISVMLNTQSPDIAQGVDIGGAGDQGIMFGYACKDTADLMPAPIYYAHGLTHKLASIRKEKYSDVLGPDGKSQVSVVYKDGKVVGVDTILISTQHFDHVSIEDIRKILENEVIPTVIPEDYILDETKILVNPTGRFVIGGPKGDTGLTGRKIIVDSYGGYSRHGGGCWSGKDPTKVDRSASYMARHIAKSIVNSGLAERCEVALAYAIGVAEPVAVYVDTFGTSKLHEDTLVDTIRNTFDLTPAGIIKYLGLRDIKYAPLAAYGHIGRSPLIAPWEKTTEITVH